MSSFACVKRLQIIVFGEKFDFPFIPRFYQEKYIFAASLFAYNEISYWIENIYIYIFFSRLFFGEDFSKILGMRVASIGSLLGVAKFTLSLPRTANTVSLRNYV